MLSLTLALSGTSLASHATLAAIFAGDLSSALKTSLDKCTVFYSGCDILPSTSILPQLQYTQSLLTLDALLSTGLRENRMPGWVLAVHRNRTHVNSIKVEDMSLGRQSEIDLTLRPIRRAMYGLIAQRESGGAGSAQGEGNGIAVIREIVRIGHDNVPVEVEAISAEEIALALGSADLQCLLKSNERQRKKMMVALLQLSVDPSILAVDFRCTGFTNDPLMKIPDVVTLPNDTGNAEYCPERLEAEVYVCTYICV